MTNHYHAVVWIDHREARVFHFDHAGLLALLGDHHGVLNALDGAQARHAAQEELRAPFGINSGDGNLQAAVGGRYQVMLADFALEGRGAVTATETVALVS